MSTEATDPAAEPAPVVAQRWPTAEENALHEFERYGDRLLPGAAAFLSRGYAHSIGKMPTDRRAEEVAKVMASPLTERYLDPEYKEAALEGGQAVSPVRAALSRYLPELKAGALDELVEKWSIELVHHKSERLAGEIVRRLGKPENLKYLTRPIDRSFAPRPSAPPPRSATRPDADPGKPAADAAPEPKKRVRSTF